MIAIQDDSVHGAGSGPRDGSGSSRAGRPNRFVSSQLAVSSWPWCAANPTDSIRIFPVHSYIFKLEFVVPCSYTKKMADDWSSSAKPKPSALKTAASGGSGAPYPIPPLLLHDQHSDEDEAKQQQQQQQQDDSSFKPLIYDLSQGPRAALGGSDGTSATVMRLPAPPPAATAAADKDSALANANSSSWAPIPPTAAAPPLTSTTPRSAFRATAAAATAEPEAASLPRPSSPLSQQMAELLLVPSRVGGASSGGSGVQNAISEAELEELEASLR